MQTNSVSGSAKTGGLLLAAFRAGTTEAITWVDLQVGDLILTVASDAMKAPLGDRTGVRLPVSYADQVVLCRELGCVSPTQPIADVMFKNASSQLTFVPLVRTASDSMKMATVDFTLKFHEGVEKQLAGKDPASRGLIFGAWKLWILHQRIAERRGGVGAINYGFWDKSQRPPKPIQSVGGQHDASHYDYSQLFQPIKRMARKAATGEAVDLLDYIAPKDKIPAPYIAPYKTAPSQEAASFLDPYEEREFNLVDVLKAAGVDVEAADGWEKRGRPGFAPVGIMVHHTAGPKKGDAPSLGLCIAGRVDPKNPAGNISGPLCHIVLARSGKAHVIAANIANHAGKGAREVLEKVRRDEPVVGNAQTNKYADAEVGNTHFYGIEVENAGVGDDPYPDAQIEALGKICAALCTSYGWSANRVVHHRQWTGRKIDMSYKGDLPSMVAQLMDSGTVTFGVSFMEEEEDPLTDTEPCLPWPEAEGPASFFEEEEEPEAPAKPAAERPAKPQAAKEAAAKKAAAKKVAKKKAAKKKAAKKAAADKPKKASKKAKKAAPKAKKKTASKAKKKA